MKKCNKCKQILDLNCFGNKTESKDGKNPTCKNCRREYKKKWVKTAKGKASHAKQSKRRGREIKLWLLKQIGCNKCKYCEEKHPACLDFHHRNADEKRFVIASNKKKNKDVLLEEIAKCDVVCANCHRKLHWQD